MYNHIRMYLDKTERLFPFPYPLKAVGYYRGLLDKKYPPLSGQTTCFRDEYQFSIRLTSPIKKLKNTVNGVSFTNTFPHVLVKCPGHVYVNDYPFGGFNSLCLHYDKDAFEPFFRQHIEGGPLAWDIRLTPQISELVREITGKFPSSQDFSVADKMDILAFQLVEELILFKISKETKHLRNDRHQKIRNIASYIQMNYDNSIDLDELLSANKISRSTFFRHWHSVYDETPQVYQNNLRMKEAERLLQETDLSIGNIAAQLGFSSSAYFCAIFRKHAGCSPAEFSGRFALEGENADK